MSANDEDLNLRALNYLMTAVIHRLHQTDSRWWQEFLQEMKANRDAPSVEADDQQVLKRAIGIVEHSLKE